jgi:PAS domain S-box-containing protein
MSLLPDTNDAGLIRLAFDLAPSGMLAMSAEGRILLANREAERLFGFEAGGLAGHSVDELVPGAKRADHARHRAEFFSAPEARAMGAGRNLSGVRRDGVEFPIEIGLNPVRTPDGVVVIASIVDITARLEAERVAQDAAERARRAQKLEALGTLAGGIAHDFNNVLLGIVGYTELAQRQMGGHSGAVQDMDQVLRAAERGRQLVRRILAFTRQHETEAAPLELERVVREATDLLRASLPATIQMHVTVEPRLPAVLAEETMIHQVVLNLGTNALHAMENGGSLRVSLASATADAAFLAAHPQLAEHRLVRLSVMDTGSGMTPEVKARVFEPFFTTKPVGKGSGLGLSVIHGIALSLGGAIDLHSEPGKGTRVDLWLPAAVATLGAAVAGGEETGGPPRQLHVLFVEDEPVLAAMERRQLEALDFRVTVHTSSLEALEDFRSRPEGFDLMITDNTMPGMTGLVLARHVTALRPGLPVLMVSGYADNADAQVLLDHGITAVLRKPHTLKELEEALRPLLGR